MASSWQTLSNVLTTVRSLVGKDTTTLPDSELLPIANKYYYLIVRELIGLNENFYAEISSSDLVLNQEEYVLPIDNTTNTYGGGLIKIQRAEISYDNINWRVITPLSLPSVVFPVATDASVATYYSSSYPSYWFADRSLWLAPAPDSDNYTTPGNGNLRIYWIKRPSEMTATSDIPDLPKDWLAVLQEGILYDVYRRFSRTNEATDAKQNYYASVQRMRELEQDTDSDQQLRLQMVHKRYD